MRAWLSFSVKCRENSRVGQSHFSEPLDYFFDWGEALEITILPPLLRISRSISVKPITSSLACLLVVEVCGTQFRVRLELAKNSYLVAEF